MYMKHDRKQIAERMLAHYNVPNKVVSKCFTDKTIEAFFNFDTGQIEVCENRMRDVNHYKKTLLHEINHAIHAKNMSLRNFDKAYNEESNRLEQVGKDPYWDNRYEIVAERFAETELQYWT